MTFGETKRLLRRFRAIEASLRQSTNVRSMRDLPDAFFVERGDYEALEFGLAHVKVWVPGLDDDAEGFLPGKSRWMRQNFLYRRANIEREHVLFKGIPVFTS
jgi:hypothetical protein